MTQLDFSLEYQVGTALKENPYLLGRTLRCETHQGQVKLRGVVRTYFQKQMAQESIRRIDGVKEILNELEVTRTE
jgi:osmotically-inducible protein OsmY